MLRSLRSGRPNSKLSLTEAGESDNSAVAVGLHIAARQSPLKPFSLGFRPVALKTGVRERMTHIAGIVILIFLIAAGLRATGAEAVLEALPFELALICGAGLATVLIANSPAVVQSAGHGLWLTVRGSRWRRSDYGELLGVLHELARRVRKSGHISVEADIEAPESSALFARASVLSRDTGVRELVCEAFRLLAMDFGRQAHSREPLQRVIGMQVEHRMRGVAALNALADTLPALGIVAAVLGIIKTMASIDQSTAIIGAMIASALLGTFLGVLLAYGFVGPLAVRVGQIVEDESRALDVVADFVAVLASGATPRAAVESARGAIPTDCRPDLQRLDQAIEAARFVAPAPTQQKRAV